MPFNAAFLCFENAVFFCFSRETAMRLTINGKEQEMADCATLADLVRKLSIPAPHFAIALNCQVVPRSQLDAAQIKDGDKIEIVHAVGGGI